MDIELDSENANEQSVDEMFERLEKQTHGK